MYEDYRTVPSYAMIRHWKRVARISVTLCIAFVVFCLLVIGCAQEDLDSEFNLYYVLWKYGMRRYESAVALSGLHDDYSYQQHFIGMKKEEFLETFPNTFWGVKIPYRNAFPGEEWYVEDYRNSQTEEGGGGGWRVVFENGRVYKFECIEGP